MLSPGTMILVTDFKDAMLNPGTATAPICTVEIERVVHPVPGLGVFYWTKEGNYILVTVDVTGADHTIFFTKPEQVSKLRQLEKDKHFVHEFLNLFKETTK